MPTYDYICENCGCEFEHFQSITAKPLRKCSSCGKLKLKRLIGAGSCVIFKGAGFYQTDYRSKNYKDAQKKEKEKTEKSPAAPGAAKKKTETKDSKPPAKDKSETKNKKKSA